jgi:hypothetical protein
MTEAMPNIQSIQPARHRAGRMDWPFPCDPGTPVRWTGPETSGLVLRWFIVIDREPRRRAGQGKPAMGSRVALPGRPAAPVPPASVPRLDFAPAG